MSVKSISCVIVFFALAFTIVACNSTDLESVALDAFRQFADVQKIPYDRVSVRTLSNDGTYAIVRITAWFRPSSQSDWVEQFADVELRKVGGKWYASTSMSFQDTLATQQTRTAVANMTSTLAAATQIAAQATYQASTHQTQTAQNAAATATASVHNTQVAADATSIATQRVRVTEEVTIFFSSFTDAAKRRDCNALVSLVSSNYLKSYNGQFESFCATANYQYSYINDFKILNVVLVPPGVAAEFLINNVNRRTLFLVNDNGWRLYSDCDFCGVQAPK